MQWERSQGTAQIHSRFNTTAGDFAPPFSRRRSHNRGNSSRNNAEEGAPKAPQHCQELTCPNNLHAVVLACKFFHRTYRQNLSAIGNQLTTRNEDPSARSPYCHDPFAVGSRCCTANRAASRTGRLHTANIFSPLYSRFNVVPAGWILRPVPRRRERVLGNHGSWSKR